MKWDEDLPGCFGAIDCQFAVHPLDQGRAFQWLTKLRKADATMADAEAQIRAYLASKDVGKEIVEEQIQRAKRMLGPWLAW